jgi:hypothetical protein
MLPSVCLFGKGKVHPITGHKANRWGWVVNAMPRPLYPPGKSRYPLYRRLGGPQGRSGQVQKILPPLGFNIQTVLPIASCYTDCWWQFTCARKASKTHPIMGYARLLNQSR